MNKRNLAVRVTATVLSAMLLALAGCGASTGKSAGSVNFTAAAEDMGNGNGTEAYSMQQDSALGEESGEGQTEASSETAQTPVTGQESTTEISRKIVYSGNAQIQTKNYDTAKKQMLQLVEDCGGFIKDQSETTDSDSGYYYASEDEFDRDNARRIWSLTVRVPSKNFDRFFDGAGKIDGKITERSSNSQDLTRTYQDNEDRLRALRTEQDRLLELLKKAENVADMITIEDKLADVRARIAELSRKNNQIDYDVSYSTVDVTLREVKFYSPQKISYAERLRNAFEDSGETFVNAMQQLLIVLIYLLPFIIVLVLLIAAIIFTVRKIKRRRSRQNTTIPGTKSESEKKP